MEKPAILAGSVPAEILEKLLDGDPLEISARCRERIRTQAVLLTLDRLYLRVIARIAHAAPQFTEVPDLDIWIADRISASLRELIDEDVEDDLREVVCDGEAEERYRFVAKAFGLEPQLARRGCAAFNLESHRVRRAFFEIVVERKPFDRYVAEGNGTAAAVDAHLKRAFRALGVGDGRAWGRDAGGRQDG